MPAFLQSDDDDAEGYGEGLLSGVNVRRRRRQYDERMDEDDAEGEEVSTRPERQRMWQSWTFADTRSGNVP